jgi:hypothetical protein
MKKVLTPEVKLLIVLLVVSYIVGKLQDQFSL